MNPKPLIYIAGPYSKPDPIANTRRAVAVGMSLWERGRCAVIIPHLTLIADLIDPRPVAHWYRFDLDQLVHCNAVYRLRGDSNGADVEVNVARQHDIPVFYEPDTGYLSDLLLEWLGDRPHLTDGYGTGVGRVAS